MLRLIQVFIRGNNRYFLKGKEALTPQDIVTFRYKTLTFRHHASSI